MGCRSSHGAPYAAEGGVYRLIEAKDGDPRSLRSIRPRVGTSTHAWAGRTTLPGKVVVGGPVACQNPKRESVIGPENTVVRLVPLDGQVGAVCSVALTTRVGERSSAAPRLWFTRKIW